MISKSSIWKEEKVKKTVSLEEITKEEFNRQVNENLEKYIAESEMSVSEVAKKSGLTPPAICRYKAENRTPNLYNAFRIAEALGISIEDLVRKA